MNEVVTYTLCVNERHYNVESSWLGESLLYVLRDRLGFMGTKNACEQGECGSCSVLIDGCLTCSCLELAVTAVDTNIVTIEGLSTDGELTDVQQAFLAEGGVQCGFCTPGLIVTVHKFLEENPVPTDLEIKEALAGNLCRCTGYGRIESAVRRVLEMRRG